MEAASSVIAVVSLTVQIAGIVQQLVEFWDSVKEAPSEVAQIKSQLVVLAGLLGSIQDDVQPSEHHESVDIGHQCLTICRQGVAKLESLTNSFDKGLSGKPIRRRWTQLRKALKDRELSKYRDEIERAKSMVVMYQIWRNG